MAASKLGNLTQNLSTAWKRSKGTGNATGDMSLMSHLGELRNRVIIAGVAIALGAIAAFFMWDWILRVATEPYCDAQTARGLTSEAACQLYITNPLELFTTRLTISTYLGFMFASPVILWQLWRFITPGLHNKEKRYAIPFVVTSVVLFALGCLVAWFTIPQALGFLLKLGTDQIETLFNPTPYLKLIFLMMVLFGVAFETPLLLVFLQLARVITSKQLRSVRRYAIVANSGIAAVATPSADPYSMLAMFIPLCIFYEVAIIVGRIFKR